MVWRDAGARLYRNQVGNGLRLPNINEAVVEEAIADKSIVRTWAMRGTLHVIAAEDVRWILTLLRPRLHTIIGTYCRKFELDEAVLAKSQACMIRILQGDKQLTRPELKAALGQEGIRTHDLRLNLLLVRVAIDGIICCGCRRGKELTYTLLDEWVPSVKPVNHDEALAELTLRYFASHGPATVADFVWWSGLRVSDAKTGLELVKSSLLSKKIDGQSYWMASAMNNFSETLTNVCLLPPFDEYLVAYKDRSAALGTIDFSRIVTAGNGLFKPVVVINGQVAGTWKRTIKKNQLDVETSFFAPLSKINHDAIEAEINRYSTFLNITA